MLVRSARVVGMAFLLFVCYAGELTGQPEDRPEPSRREILLDALAEVGNWRLTGPPTVSPLQGSVLGTSRSYPRETSTTCLRLRASFGPDGPEYLAAGGSARVPGHVCRALSLWIWSDHSSCPLGMIIEDARGRWYARGLGILDWDGWKRVVVDVGDGNGWTPLLRDGESAEPLTHPIVLRQIRLRRPDGPARPVVATVCFSDLQAAVDASGLGALAVQMDTGRPGGVFWDNEPVDLRIRILNSGTTAMVGTASAVLSPLLGEDTVVNLGEVAVPADSRRELRLTRKVGCYGVYVVRLIIKTRSDQRIWHGNFTKLRSSPAAERTASHRFGACGSVAGFTTDQRSFVARLNRSGGMGWARMGLSWEQVNPVPGVWVWDPPVTAAGPIGSALNTAGRSYLCRTPVLQQAADEITIAFWARGTGPSERTLWPFGCGDAGSVPTCGVFFHRQTGNFAFSARYEKQPEVNLDFDSGMGAFNGQWHHYAVTYSRYIKQISLYVDGAAKTTADHDGGRLLGTARTVRVGVGGPMELDQILVYSRALGPADVAALARKGPPPIDGIVAAWTFDQSPSRLTDAVGGCVLKVEEPDGIEWAREARAQGMRVVTVLGFPPAWAATSRGGHGGPSGLPQMSAWAAYVERVTRQYRGLIDHWEIWHQPNSTDFWPETPDPRRYLQLLKTAYAAAKRGNPRCTVLMPGLLGPDGNGGGMEYLESLIRIGAARYCDGISIHPYRKGSPESTAFARQLQRISDLSASAGGRKPIWITELSWSTEIPTGVSEERQAAMLARAYVLAAATGHVEGILWYRLHDWGSDRTIPDENCGLCREDLSPKPAFVAHRTLSVLIGNAQPLAAPLPAHGAYISMFRSGSERLAAVWAAEGRRALALATRRPRIAFTDLMGNSSFRATDEDVLMLEASEMPAFVRGLRSTARWLDEPVAIADASVLHGGTVRTTIRIRNPFASARQVRLDTSVGPEWRQWFSVEPASTTVTVGPRGSATVNVRVTASPNAPPGSVELRLRSAFVKSGAATVSRGGPSSSVTVTARLTVE